ncbi:MAG TPA: SDR family oxidoreductase [Albitalea sp.]
MNILIAGATGFIGSRLRTALLARGHRVVGVARRAPSGAAPGEWIALDFGRVTREDWAVHLAGIDAAVNAVGILRQTPAQRFAELHVGGPTTLFEACARHGVRRVVQVSALGADEQAETDYHRSKKMADDVLLALPLDAAVVQPSLVFGPAGASARMFLGWASLPVLPLPAGGGQPVQPVHVDDVVQALVVLVETMPAPWRGARVPLVGPAPTTLAGYLQSLRAAMRLPPARTVSIPAGAMQRLARVGDRLPGSLLDTDSWRMLQRGNVAPADATAALLGRPPREPARFVEADHASAARSQARLAWLLPLLRLSLALVWIVTGIVSMGVYPVDESYALLARSGVPEALRPTMLYGAAALDLALGVLTLWPLRQRRSRLALWASQAALILVYTAIITIRLPEFWLHPYGPVLKNLPILAALLLLAMLDPGEEPPG